MVNGKLEKSVQEEGTKYECVRRYGHYIGLNPTTQPAFLPPKHASDMKLLKIKDRFINIDLVQTATLEQDSIVLTLSGESFRFSGGDAKLITNWLNRFALDLNRDRTKTSTQTNAERPPANEWEGRTLQGGLFRKPFAS